jgi:phage shock protein PspC (stress-responsive transcriptional regulator)
VFGLRATSGEVKRLYRNTQNGKIAGVCAGIADYFNIDVVVVRLAAVLLAFMGGAGFIAYIVAWIITPVKLETN